MISIRPTLRRSRALPVLAAAITASVVTVVLVAPGSAQAHRPPTPHAVPAPPANPTRADQIQNVDQVKTAVKAYYGDTASTEVDPVNGSTTLHFASPQSGYAHEMAGIVRTAGTYLARAQRQHGHAPGHSSASRKRAIVLDVDDTTLNTYSYEIYSNFVYNPTTNADFVNAAVFPAVFHMPGLVNAAQAEGYTIFFLTGRPSSQLAGTQTNLQADGYPAVPNSQVYLKDLTDPWLSSCATTTPTCTTIQYKSLTRQHIESLGYDIVANFGDQYSDLEGGFADRSFKLPNPMYYLP